MGLPKYKDLDALNQIEEINKEIFLLQQTLFDLKLNTIAKKNTKIHLFKHTKRRITQLKYKKSFLIPTKSEISIQSSINSKLTDVIDV
jgi:ribosomal protein L29